MSKMVEMMDEMEMDELEDAIRAYGVVMETTAQLAKFNGVIFLSCMAMLLEKRALLSGIDVREYAMELCNMVYDVHGGMKDE